MLWTYLLKNVLPWGKKHPKFSLTQKPCQCFTNVLIAFLQHSVFFLNICRSQFWRQFSRGTLWEYQCWVQKVVFGGINPFAWNSFEVEVFSPETCRPRVHSPSSWKSKWMRKQKSGGWKEVVSLCRLTSYKSNNDV